MFNEEFHAVCNAGKAKVNLMKKNPLGYFIAAVLAGIFVGFGGLVSFTISGILTTAGDPGMAKVVMSASFAAALSMVVMAGSELFTGNNFVMTSAALNKSVSWGNVVCLWVFCYLGNLVGSVLTAFLFHMTKVPTGAIGEYIAGIAATKMSGEPMVLFFKGILCNALVCLAVWCCTKMKSESGKLIMIFWCIYVFMICGFEHSVANMTVMAIGLFDPCGAAVSIGGYFYNLALVTAGNMVGGIVLIAIPYYLISRQPK